MSKPFTPKVITASALLEGDVIYLSENDTWVRDLSAAEVITDEAHAQLRMLYAQSQPNVVVGVYLADVTPSGTGPKPAHFREEFRATGPSNYAHGKQEVSSHV